MNISSDNIRKIFRKEFGSVPLLIHSPGRVNLIGEHTDYNDGFVLPAAINKRIVLAMAPNNLGKIRLFAADMEKKQYETEFQAEPKKSGLHWPDYILGVVKQLIKGGHNLDGFDLAFGGDIPIGAGLSSSAALEGGVVFGLTELFDLDLNRTEMAKIGQLAENKFVGVQCGIMDQFANLHGKEGSVIKLDCRSLEYEHYPFERDDLSIVLFDTNVRRELASSEYNIRRQQCEEGVSILREFDPAIKNLRDVSDELLENHKEKLSEVVYNRCRYVLDENRRVLDACDNLQKGDFKTFGKLMYSSHYGLRDLYEVSCRELDVLVDATESLHAVPGARMMGGGFGGCTINLVIEDEIDGVVESVKAFYKKELGKKVTHHVAKIGPGVSVLEMA